MPPAAHDLDSTARVVSSLNIIVYHHQCSIKVNEVNYLLLLVPFRVSVKRRLAVDGELTPATPDEDVT